MFIAHAHNNYALYVPVLLITVINLSDTHPRCKELLEQNVFSVSQSLVLCLRNDFDITIRQTIKRYYRLQQLELRFILSYYRWNGVLLITSELSILKQLFNALAS